MKINISFLWLLILAFEFSCSDNSSTDLSRPSINTRGSAMDLLNTRALGIVNHGDPDFSKLLVVLNYELRNQNVKCNGFIIAPYKIVTNGHCFLSPDPFNALQDLEEVNVTKLKIRFGQTEIQENTEVLLGSAVKRIRFFDNGKESLKADIKEAQKYTGSDPDHQKELENHRRQYFYMTRNDIAVIELDPDQISSPEAKNFFKERPTDFSFAPKDLSVEKAQSIFDHGFIAAFSTPHQEYKLPYKNVMLRIAPFKVRNDFFRLNFSAPTVFSTPLEREPGKRAHICAGDSGSVMTIFDPENKRHMIFALTLGGSSEPNQKCRIIPFFLHLPHFYEWLGIH